jgi:hypothetical protein
MTDPQDSPSESQKVANELIDLANAEQRKRSQAAPSRPGPSREGLVRVSLAVAVPVLVAALLLNFAGPFLDTFFETQPPAPVAREEAQKTLDALVGEIDAFRKDYNELPETLVEIGLPSRGEWTYTMFGKGQYRLQGQLYGQAVSFDSTATTGNR